MKTRFRFAAIVRAVALVAAAAYALTAAAVHTGSEQHPTVVNGDAIPWSAAPPSLPGGAQATVLYGNPGKEGPFAIRLRFPAGYVVPPHRHSQDELVTVLSGRFGVMTGERIDRGAFKPLAPGSFVNIPAGAPHYAMTETEAMVQINGMGPFDITYVDKKDDPRAQ